MEDLFKKMRTACWDKALDCAAYSYIYTQKVNRVGKWLRWSKVLGFIIPVALGGIVSGYYTYPIVMQIALAVAAATGLLQLIVSAYLTAVGSDEKLISYMRKASEYNLLNAEFEQLAAYPLRDEQEYSQRFRILIERENGVGKDNLDVSDADRRMGMRHGLRNYKRNCVKCGEIPYDMTPTNCPVCGNFKL